MKGSDDGIHEKCFMKLFECTYITYITHMKGSDDIHALKMFDYIYDIIYDKNVQMAKVHSLNVYGMIRTQRKCVKAIKLFEFHNMIWKYQE